MVTIMKEQEPQQSQLHSFIEKKELERCILSHTTIVALEELEKLFPTDPSTDDPEKLLCKAMTDFFNAKQAFDKACSDHAETMVRVMQILFKQKNGGQSCQ